MDQTLLDHLFKLAAKTGDRLIIVDPATQQPFVLMGIAQYEALRVEQMPKITPIVKPKIVSNEASQASVPDSLVQRANAELAAWRSEQGMPMPAVPSATAGEYAPEPIETLPTEEQRFYVEPVE